MAKGKKTGEVADDLAGTVEGQARDYWEREKAAYEERTGEKVKYEPSVPTTRTPVSEPHTATAVSGEEPVNEAVAEATEGEGA